ncbi:hypothetical protein, partial [Acidocella sp. MX-AZ02]|uniref:hypothetical protein n=1 Tax=Acidocella sp. MX-AZ02 TaxID=1214225 RepID=UPI00196A0AC8
KKGCTPKTFAHSAGGFFSAAAAPHKNLFALQLSRLAVRLQALCRDNGQLQPGERGARRIRALRRAQISLPSNMFWRPAGLASINKWGFS